MVVKVIVRVHNMLFLMGERKSSIEVSDRKKTCDFYSRRQRLITFQEKPLVRVKYHIFVL